MYKSKLQELCQRRSLGLPEYSSVKDGPDHMPRFTATVAIQGQPFATSALCKSSKEAQNTAAKIAIDRLSAPLSPPQPQEHGQLPPRSPPPAPVAQIPPLQDVVPDALASPVAQLHTPDGLAPISPLPSSLPTPTLGLLMTKSANASSIDVTDEIVQQNGLLMEKSANGSTVVGNVEIVQQNGKDTAHASMVYGVGSHDKPKKVNMHMYKNKLQQFTQKHNLGLPVYTNEYEGPPHVRRYKSSVTVEKKLYGTSDLFPTLKEAEQAAAKIACQMLFNVVPEDVAWYKNLLQEHVQKRGMKCPSYETISSGMPHSPLFVSTVEVGNSMVRGAEATTRKQAEMNAAKAAYYALVESVPAAEVSNSPPVTECGVADNFSRIIHPDAALKKHENPTAEENPVNAKRAKSSPENADVNAEECLLKTVVCPRESNLPPPEDAALLPYSDGQWVAYTVKEQEQEPISQI